MRTNAQAVELARGTALRTQYQERRKNRIKSIAKSASNVAFVMRPASSMQYQRTLEAKNDNTKN
jgi:hypothetical protein